MIVRQVSINDGFGRPLNMAARAVSVSADKMASVVYRAIEEEPNEIRSQHKKGDPRCCFGHSIHMNTPSWE